MVVYEAGPMSGIPECNFPEFMRVAESLRARGLTVINPAEEDVVRDGFIPGVSAVMPMSHYMRRDLPLVLSADAVVVLDGWRRSKGACLEVHVARECGIPVWDAYTLEPVPDEPEGPLRTTPVLAGICGPIGSGKSLLAALLVERLAPAVVLSMAAPLKRIALEMGWNGRKDGKGRRLLQMLGTECGRQCIGENVWLDLWARDASRLLAAGTSVVADDIRFENEAAHIRQAGGLIIHMCGNHSNTPAAQHASEGGVKAPATDQIAHNPPGSYRESLEAEADRLVAYLKT